MRVLALEPYYGGSHRAFLDAWIAESRHRWTLLTLPPFAWKWRMRHGAITFARDLEERSGVGESWDVLFCSDMLDLAAFKGLAPRTVRDLPAVAYFHENQLTYPVRFEAERDLHFALTNVTTALAADAVWFNSDFHRRELLDAIPLLLRKMPDHQPLDAGERIRQRSHVVPQGIEPMPERGERRPGPLRILWAARWEFDKDPETFFAALGIARDAGVAFRLSVLGESFRQVPEVFRRAREDFTDRIDRWGFQESRDDYRAALLEADVVVSTAVHEFFGISVVEAIAAGCYPLLPERLAYPEILAEIDGDRGEFFYGGSAKQLAARLGELAAAEDLWCGDPTRGRRAVTRFAWPALRPRLDRALSESLES
ncbi:MAG: DUF3524 domain-containing protein [Acidobacteriota bacterium]